MHHQSTKRGPLLPEMQPSAGPALQAALGTEDYLRFPLLKSSAHRSFTQEASSLKARYKYGDVDAQNSRIDLALTSMHLDCAPPASCVNRATQQIKGKCRPYSSLQTKAKLVGKQNIWGLVVIHCYQILPDI